MGLPDETLELVQSLVAEPSGEVYLGMFENEYPLMQYREPSAQEECVRAVQHYLSENDFEQAALRCVWASNADSTKPPALFKEKHQCAPWSSGPMHFLKLVDAKGEDVCVWSEDAVQEAL
jgi:hypothetical protein